MVPSVAGYRIVSSIEPPHPQCTISDAVYDAMGPRGRVALKVIFLGFPLRDKSRARYLELQRGVQAIDHPSVIPLVDFGFTEDDKPFYAMPFIDGETVADRAARTSTSAPEVAAILERVAEGIVASQRAGCAPSADARHIMLTSRGAQLWHLGIDHWRNWAMELVTGQYTNSGQYMRHANVNPFDARGLPSTGASACADLALIAFNLLANRPYWEADLDLGGPPYTMLTEVLANAGPPPSERSKHPLPAGFDAWFARCLAGELDDPREAARSFPAH